MRSAPTAISSLLLVALGFSSWSMSITAQGTPPAVTRTGSQDVILATTTSTADTGLLDALAPLLAEATGYTLKPIAVGSGAARSRETQTAAVIVTHDAPEALALADRLLVLTNGRIAQCDHPDVVLTQPADVKP
jgi:tungstate transport system substrate-binding protein